jgi:hypothetical protein
MPGCVLHVSGDDFRVDAFLADSNLRPYRVHHRGDIARRSQHFTNSGLSLNVSSADGDLDAEIPDAIAFLSTHEAELPRLHDFPGVTDMRSTSAITTATWQRSSTTFHRTYLLAQASSESALNSLLCCATTGNKQSDD